MWHLYVAVEGIVLAVALLAAFAVSLRIGAWRRP